MRFEKYLKWIPDQVGNDEYGLTGIVLLIPD